MKTGMCAIYVKISVARNFATTAASLYIVPPTQPSSVTTAASAGGQYKSKRRRIDFAYAAAPNPTSTAKKGSGRYASAAMAVHKTTAANAPWSAAMAPNRTDGFTQPYYAAGRAATLRKPSSRMKPTKQDVARQFDRMSHAYAQSSGHARGDDLAIVLEFLAPQAAMRVLDVATGAGHTAAAVAPFVTEVIAIDIAPAMLARTQELASARGLRNLKTALMDVEALQFPDAWFDAVTCRIAPHHFLDVDRAIAEIARVLRTGGAFVVEDSVVPDDPALDGFVNGVEAVRDPTHVRSLTAGEWKSKLEASGLGLARSTTYVKTHDVAEWIERAGLDGEGVARVYAAFDAAPDEAVRRFAIEFAHSRAVRFADEKIIIRAEKQPH
jgi:ubiquinone/menaquinone biosynthesis C-methylase UbiE